MRDRWVKHRLADVTSKIGSGATPRGGDASYKEAGVSLIRSLNVHDANFRSKDLAHIDDTQASALSNVIVEAEDVLLNITGASIARCCLVPSGVLPARVNQHVSILRPRKDQLLPKFLHYMLISKHCKERLLNTGEAGGSTRQALTKAQLQEFLIEFPADMTEQQRIVSILDEVFADIATAKANAERNLQNTSELFENHHHALFAQRDDDWRESLLGELGEFRNGVNYTKQSKGHRVRVVGVKDFKNGFDIPLSGLDTAQLDGPLSPIDALRENDILFVRSNGNPELIGRSLLAGPVEEKITHSGFTIRLRLFGADVSPRYLCHFLKTPAVRRGLTDAGTGANIRSLNQQMLSAITVPIPSKSEQAAIVARLESSAKEMSELANVYQRKLAALDELKQSLLAKAFAGELT